MTADEIPPPTTEDLERMRRAMEGPIDTSDIPERPVGAHRVRRDAFGRLPHWPKGPICMAILKELGRCKMTRYELWKAAHARCATLSESAVYEFLRGQRQIGSKYLEAILKALDMTVVRRPRRKLAGRRSKRRAAAAA